MLDLELEQQLAHARSIQGMLLSDRPPEHAQIEFRRIIRDNIRRGPLTPHGVAMRLRRGETPVEDG